MGVASIPLTLGGQRSDCTCLQGPIAWSYLEEIAFTATGSHGLGFGIDLICCSRKIAGVTFSLFIGNQFHNEVNLLHQNE